MNTIDTEILVNSNKLRVVEKEVCSSTLRSLLRQKDLQGVSLEIRSAPWRSQLAILCLRLTSSLAPLSLEHQPLFSHLSRLSLWNIYPRMPNLPATKEKWRREEPVLCSRAALASWVTSFLQTFETLSSLLLIIGGLSRSLGFQFIGSWSLFIKLFLLKNAPQLLANSLAKHN